jgi:hypothetical protein
MSSWIYQTDYLPLYPKKIDGGNEALKPYFLEEVILWL